MALGVWHFAAKSHINVKRIYNWFGNVVNDNTVRKALDSFITFSSIARSTEVHSLSGKCSGCTQFTYYLIHSFITSDNQVPAFRASRRVSWQYEKAEAFSFDSSKTYKAVSMQHEKENHDVVG